MTLLPPWLALYLALGLALMLLICWRTPQVVTAPPGGRLAQTGFTLGLIAGFTLLWPFPVAVACRSGWPILRAAWRDARRKAS